MFDNQLFYLISQAETDKKINRFKRIVMNDQDKTKEELIKELQELQQEYNSLKASYNKDISEHKQAEEIQKKYSAIFEQSPIAIEFYDSYGNLINVNSACLRLFGVVNINEISGFKLFEDPNISEDIKAKLLNIESVRFEAEFNFEVVKKLNLYQTTCSGIKILDWSITPLTNGNLVVGYIEQIQDITQRKRAQEDLQIKDWTIESSTNAIVTSDLKGNLNYVNLAFLKLWGYNSSSEVLGKHFMEFWQMNKKAAEVMQAVYTNGEWQGELVAQGKNGVLFDAQVVSSLVLNDEDQPICIQSSFLDITEKRKILKDLFLAKKEAEESDKLKSAFLANMSHEIRTPMNGILGFSELLKEPDLTGEQQQEFIRIIEESGVRMLDIINAIIDISKIESGLMKTDIKELNIYKHIEYLYTFFKPEVEEKRIQLLFKNTLAADEAIIRTDSEKFSSILIKLVKNAIKYSEEGSVEFGYDKKGEYLEFFVKDTGIGIPKDRQSAIFERFIQADISDKRAYQGAGLGLSISKAYVEMLGGKIWVESEEGIGSTFYFTLPYNVELEEKNVVGNILSSDKADNHICSEVSGLKILIAEDDEISEKLIHINVENFSKEILKVRNGSEAVETCRNNPDIDLILMDIQMPEMDGYEATRQIRQINKDVVIIAQTAFGLTGDREKAIEAGCNDYIAKPINSNLLKEMIQRLFKK
jgi:PAS domain S-box-containing protein